MSVAGGCTTVQQEGLEDRGRSSMPLGLRSRIWELNRQAVAQVCGCDSDTTCSH